MGERAYPGDTLIIQWTPEQEKKRYLVVKINHALYIVRSLTGRCINNPNKKDHKARVFRDLGLGIELETIKRVLGTRQVTLKKRGW